MEKIITMQNLRSLAYCNIAICQKPIRGIVLSFFGRGGSAMYDEETDDGRRYAEKGILYLKPYQNPWAWMNRQTVDYVDELLDVLFAACGLPDDLPIVSTGGSMGGLSAIVYMAYAKRTPVACVANCPVCDLVYHFTERPDLPRTLYSAFYHEEGTVDEVLAKASPLHLTKEMPKVQYHIFHCDQDKAVNLQKHSGRFVDEMKTLGHELTFDIVPGRGHCDLTDEMMEKYRAFVVDAVMKKQREKMQ